MTANNVARCFLAVFVGLFFIYLFGPLLVMGVTAFNSSAFPRVTPFECFSVEWFGALAADAKLMRGLANSVVIGIGVVVLAVPVGMAGALLLAQVPDRARPWYYTIAISPILIPGVVLGISTLVFWDRLGRMFGASGESVFYNGVFLTIVGQTTFVSAYCMLIFIARLQRFDSAQEEAARDLGATPAQSFRKVLLPFLKPAIGSAAVLAFLASFENYNTTVFTSLTSETLVTVLASKVRHGIDPSISALAVVIIALTLAGAAAYEILKRRETHGQERGQEKKNGSRAARAALFLNPALAAFVLISVVGIGTIYFAGTLGVEECKVAAQAEKRRRAQERIEALRRAHQRQEAPPAPQEDGIRRPSETPSIFAPDNIEVPGAAETETRPTERNENAPPQPPRTADPFAPENLAPGSRRRRPDDRARADPSNLGDPE